MPTKGRYLELLMKCLQEYFAGETYKVTSPERFYDDDGTLIGEIDVTVRGEFGGASLFWAIECRARPSERSQGVGWIREIVGKKDQLKPDKMIAVSSTGFSKPAISYAAEKGVELIVLEKLSQQALAEHFPKVALSLFGFSGEFPMTVSRRLADNKVLGQTTSLETHINGQKRRVVLTMWRNDNNTLSAKFSLFDEAGNEANWPKGEFTLYGYK